MRAGEVAAQAIGVAKKWAAGRDDTLIVATADHNHSMAVIGIHDRTKGTGRAANLVYAEAGFPNFVDSNGDVVNGSIFFGVPGQPLTQRAVTIFGVTGLTHNWKWRGAQWVE